MKSGADHRFRVRIGKRRQPASGPERSRFTGLRYSQNRVLHRQASTKGRSKRVEDLHTTYTGSTPHRCLAGTELSSILDPFGGAAVTLHSALTVPARRATIVLGSRGRSEWEVGCGTSGQPSQRVLPPTTSANVQAISRFKPWSPRTLHIGCIRSADRLCLVLSQEKKGAYGLNAARRLTACLRGFAVGLI
jgi:hypothetical protein